MKKLNNDIWHSVATQSDEQKVKNQNSKLIQDLILMPANMKMWQNLVICAFVNFQYCNCNNFTLSPFFNSYQPPHEFIHYGR